MDPIFLAVAFILGFLTRQIALPPMIGFLLAGFLLKALGYESNEILVSLADLGVTLLLFSIGLKLRVETLAKPEVWGTTTLHMAISMVVFSIAVFVLSITGLQILTDLDLAAAGLVAFALSFSSTVFAIKALEEKGELQTLHGRVAIGILVMQDIIAVVFITLSLGKVPSQWALLLFALPLLRPLFYLIMDRCGHGELIPLFGLFAALILGAQVFTQVGLKADLGALVLGVLLSRHHRADEISKSLLSFKDILLIGFFLNIGLTGTLSVETLGLAALLTLFVPLKTALFFFLLTRFKLRARSATLTAISLSTYSEFGLIVGSIGVTMGVLPADWLTVIAIALAMTFVIGSPISAMAHDIYAKYDDHLRPLERSKRLPDDRPIEVGDARIMILGMGRVGAGAYDAMQEAYGPIVIGLESNPDKVDRQKESGRAVVAGDATDSDFWERLPSGKIGLVMLTLPELNAKLDVIRRLQDSNYDGRVVAAARFADDIQALDEAGVDMAVDTFAQAGNGFADDVQSRFADDLKGLTHSHS
ncbi:MAG: cation:proton antiporter family protein [Pseudomonadota bacterium]